MRTKDVFSIVLMLFNRMRGAGKGVGYFRYDPDFEEGISVWFFHVVVFS